MLLSCPLLAILDNKLACLLAAIVGVSNIDLSAWEDKNNPSESRFPAQLNNLELAVNLDKRENLSGAENLWAIVPASGFSFSSQQIWKIIKENKDLDLPAHKVMVATVCCEEIANEKYVSFTEN
ncbi:hypothetical protein FXO38_12200 [Capsicum annuum]|nr:hypothetical protein FXO38_12200 [Capsicum annuum]